MHIRKKQDLETEGNTLGTLTLDMVVRIARNLEICHGKESTRGEEKIDLLIPIIAFGTKYL